MEKKNPGRSLVDISRTFMTSEEESFPDESSPIFLSTPVREETCSACLNVIEQPPGPLKCKIFSSKNEEYGGLFLKSIMPGYAKYCRYFESLVACDVGNEKDIEKTDSDAMQYSMEVEETINRQKKIALKDDGKIQDNFKKMLSQHLENGYEIVRIVLERKEDHENPSCRIKRHETVTIFKKDPLS
ncbi:MAG: hypothetical protein PVG39_11105 [Desulfobacteraceae bacterium]